MGKIIQLRQIGDPILNQKSENVDCQNNMEEEIPLTVMINPS